jgi:hypothetical protein
MMTMIKFLIILFIKHLIYSILIKYKKIHHFVVVVVVVIIAIINDIYLFLLNFNSNFK